MIVMNRISLLNRVDFTPIDIQTYERGPEWQCRRAFSVEDFLHLEGPDSDFQVIYKYFHAKKRAGGCYFLTDLPHLAGMFNTVVDVGPSNTKQYKIINHLECPTTRIGAGWRGRMLGEVYESNQWGRHTVFLENEYERCRGAEDVHCYEIEQEVDGIRRWYRKMMAATSDNLLYVATRRLEPSSYLDGANNGGN